MRRRLQAARQQSTLALLALHGACRPATHLRALPLLVVCHDPIHNDRLHSQQEEEDCSVPILEWKADSLNLHMNNCDSSLHPTACLPTHPRSTHRRLRARAAGWAPAMQCRRQVRRLSCYQL